MSIALSNYLNLANCYLIQSMQTVTETRRQRLMILINKYGETTKLNEAIGRDPGNPQLGLYKNRNLRKNGKHHQMGDLIAREIEEKLGLPQGWMDTPPTYTELLGEEDPMAKIIMVAEKMSPEMQRFYAQLGHTALEQPAFSPAIQIANGASIAASKPNSKDIPPAKT